GNHPYDTGMIETRYQNLIVAEEPVNGVARKRAYDTRLYFQGNLLTGRVRRLNNKDITHKGSSEYFSNRMGRGGRAVRLESANIFDVLFEKYPYLKIQEKEFRSYVNGLIEREFHYLSARLRAAGLNINMTVRGHFDLMWRAPIAQGGFPTPVLIETHKMEPRGPFSIV